MRGILVISIVSIGLCIAPAAAAKDADCDDTLVMAAEQPKRKAQLDLRPAKQQPRPARKRRLSGPILM